jgi:hypothetical protein
MVNDTLNDIKILRKIIKRDNSLQKLAYSVV